MGDIFAIPNVGQGLAPAEKTDGKRDVNEVQAKACMKFMRRINEVCYANDVFPSEI